MKNIILCSSDPILIKSLYGILRDEGYAVETIEHPALAVQMVLRKHYDLIIVGSEPFGLSAEDAVQIIKTFAPEMPVLFVDGSERRDQRSRGHALDLEEFMKTIQNITV